MNLHTEYYLEALGVYHKVYHESDPCNFRNLQPLGLVPSWGRYFHGVVVFGDQKPLNQVGGTSLFPK